jgi:hypothetical protein
MLKGFPWVSTLSDGLAKKQRSFALQPNLSQPGHGLAGVHPYQPELVLN